MIFVLKLIVFVLKLMGFVLKLMIFVFKMMNLKLLLSRSGSDLHLK